MEKKEVSYHYSCQSVQTWRHRKWADPGAKPPFLQSWSVTLHLMAHCNSRLNHAFQKHVRQNGHGSLKATTSNVWDSCVLGSGRWFCDGLLLPLSEAARWVTSFLATDTTTSVTLLQNLWCTAYMYVQPDVHVVRPTFGTVWHLSGRNQN